MEAASGFEPEIKVLQTSALPLGYAASIITSYLERETRFELATSTLARLHSTAELLPRGTCVFRRQPFLQTAFRRCAPCFYATPRSVSSKFFYFLDRTETAGT